MTLLPFSFGPGNNFFRGVLFPHWPQVIHPQGLLTAFPDKPGEHTDCCKVSTEGFVVHVTLSKQMGFKLVHHSEHIETYLHKTLLGTILSQNKYECSGTAVLLQIPMLSSVNIMGICQ